MRVILFIIITSLLLSSCATIIVPATETTNAIIDQPTRMVILQSPTAPLPTATITPAPTIITPTTTPEPLPVPTADPACVPTKFDLIYGKPAAFADFPESIRLFLNSGGSVDVLAEQLATPLFTNGARSADFNGDGKRDVIAAVYAARSEDQLAADFGFFFFFCANGEYEIRQSLVQENTSGDLRIYDATDMNNDGAAEALIAFQTCGAHTCFEDLRLLMWNGQSFNSVLTGRTDDLPYPAFEWKYDQGIMSLIETGGSYGSVGAGPTRQHLRKWSYDPASRTWIVSAENDLPSNYRIHLLLDADRMFAQSKIADAIPMYQRVAEDMTLLDWGDPASEQINLGAYARFRMIVAYVSLGQNDLAQQTFDAMSTSIAADRPEHVFVEMAQLYMQDKSCGAVESLATDRNAASLLFFGYANAEYTAQDLCP